MKTVKLTIAALIASVGVSSLAHAKVCSKNNALYFTDVNMVSTAQVSLHQPDLEKFINSGEDQDVSIYLPRTGDMLVHVKGDVGTIQTISYFSNHNPSCVETVDFTQDYVDVQNTHQGIHAKYLGIGNWYDIPGATRAQPAPILDNQIITTKGALGNVGFDITNMQLAKSPLSKSGLFKKFDQALRTSKLAS